ncbi:MAG: Crp/Fnr family transcriptional regulator [Gemmatimonadaceae bacterium]
MTPHATIHPNAELNRIITALPAETRERLAPHLELVSLRVRDPLHDARGPVEHVYFPLNAVVSLVSDIDDGVTVELATLGNEGMVGIAVFLAGETMPYRAFTQVPGATLRLPARVLVAEMARDQELGDVLKRYTQALLVQVAQTAACNRIHRVEERCARWLLMTHDRVGRAEQFPLTQEFLAQMLGVRRATVTVAAGMLQRAGLIRYTRGKITVVDRPRLEAASCGCYRVVRDETDRLLGSEPRRVALSA